MCRVLLSRFSPLDAELLMKGLASAWPDSQLRSVESEQLLEIAIAWEPDAVLLGEHLEASAAEIDAVVNRMPRLVVVRLTSRGNTATLVRRGAADVELPEISLRTLALLLCGAQPAVDH